MRRLHQYPDPRALNEDVCHRLIIVANDCLAAKGSFHLVLAGGNTPRLLYRRLREVTTTQWQGWHCYFGDERCLPTGDERRNDTMARAAWLDPIAIPARQIHPIEAERGAELAATAYDRLLQHSPRFDLVLLGLGEDGHTASLFPGDTDTPAGFKDARPVSNAPKPPPDRVSITRERLADAERIWFLATGANKRAALEGWLRNEPIPASLLTTAGGIDIFTDQDLEPIP